DGVEDQGIGIAAKRARNEHETAHAAAGRPAQDPADAAAAPFRDAADAAGGTSSPGRSWQTAGIGCNAASDRNGACEKAARSSKFRCDTVTLVYRPDHPARNENGFIDKSLLLDNIQRSAAAYVITDEIDPTRHMCDGKRYTSKAKFRE